MTEEDMDIIREFVYTRIGTASMCWEPRPSGVFDSTNAIKIAKQICDLFYNNMELLIEERDRYKKELETIKSKSIYPDTELGAVVLTEKHGIKFEE